MIRAAEIVAEARRRGLEIFLDGDKLKVRPSSRLDDDFRAFLKEHREEIRAYLAAGWPCSSCGGYSGHALRCPAGPEPAEAPTLEELLAAASALEWPELSVAVPGRRRPVLVPGRRLAWEAFARWAADKPELALAAWRGLEAFEAAWRAEAPTPAEVAP